MAPAKKRVRFGDPDKKGQHKKEHEIRNAPGVRGLDVYTQNMWIGHFVLLFFLCMIEESKVERSASYLVGCWWLLVAIFVSAGSIAHLSAFEAGGTLSELPPSTRKTRSKYACKNNAIQNLRWISNRI